MELYQLRIVCAIVENHTMTSAANALHMSQPALSAGLKKLEEELQVSLFQRDKAGMTLTEYGDVVYTYAKDIFSSLNRIETEIGRLSQRKHHITMYYDDPGPMWYITPNLEMAFGEDVFQNTVQDHPADALHKKECDICITCHAISHPDVVCEKLVDEYLLLSVPEDSQYSSYTEIDLLKDTPERIIRYTVSGNHAKENQDFWNQVSEKCDIQTYTDYFLFSQALTNQEAITVTTRIVKNYRHDGNHRVCIPIISGGTQSTYYVSWRKDDSTKLENYIRFLHYICHKIDS